MSRINKNAAKQNSLKELFRRLYFVFFALIVYRFGVHVPVPGINPEQLAQLFAQNQGPILNLFNMFSGGALERMSIFALGIIPYISASIILQLLTAVVPTLDHLKKEGEYGRRKIAQYTRYLTVVLALIQSLGISAGLVSQNVTFSGGFSFYFIAVISFVSGTVFLMWLGEQITEKGIGNGISLLIFTSIVTGLPLAVGQAVEQMRVGEINFIILPLLLAVVCAIVAFIIFVERGQRRITINYANRHTRNAGYLSQSSHLPLKINMAGVIPAIFASSILLFPASLTQWFSQSEGLSWLHNLSLYISPGRPFYVLLFFVAVVFFCFFYTAIVFNPREIANNLKKSGALITGIRPGKQTADYIDSVITRLTVFGSLYIAFVAIVPELLFQQWNVPFYLGGTSLLIVVVVAMDFMAQLQSHLLSHQYDTLMKKANIQSFAR